MKSASSASAMNRRYASAPSAVASVTTQTRRAGSSVSPMITAARPMTMVPTPMETSAPPCTCTYSAPPSAISALDSAMPPSVSRPVGTPCARAMRGLAPVARSASPVCEAKNPSSPSLTASTTSPSASGLAHMALSSVRKGEKTEGSPSSDRLGAPMMRRFTEYSAIIVRMEASSCMMPSRT